MRNFITSTEEKVEGLFYRCTTKDCATVEELQERLWVLSGKLIMAFVSTALIGSMLQ